MIAKHIKTGKEFPVTAVFIKLPDKSQMSIDMNLYVIKQDKVNNDDV